MIPWLVSHRISRVMIVLGVFYCIIAVNSLFQNIKEKSESEIRVSNEIAQEKDFSYVNIKIKDLSQFVDQDDG